MKRLLLLLVIAGSIAHTQDVTKVGTTAAKFLSIPAGTRALGFGGAFVSVADDPTFNDSKPFLQAQQLDVRVKLLPLLHKSVQINSLKLERPNLELIKNEQGGWNFSSMGSNAESRASATPPSRSNAGTSGGVNQSQQLGPNPAPAEKKPDAKK